MGGTKVKPDLKKFVVLENIPPEGKTFSQVHQECRKPPNDEWAGILERTGGPGTPREIQRINVGLFKSFACESHYVVLEKTGKEKNGADYSYVLRHHMDLTNIPPVRLDDYHPERPGILAGGFFIFPRKDKKTIVVPTHAFKNFLGRKEILAFHLSPFLSDLAGGRLIRDFELNQVNGDGNLFALDIVLADEPFEPLAIPRLSPAPPPAPVSKSASPAPIPEPLSEPWENPCDAMILAGGGGGERQIAIPRPKNLHPMGGGQIGCRLQSDTSAIELFAGGGGIRTSDGPKGIGALTRFGFGVRYPERPLVSSSAGIDLHIKSLDKIFPRLSIAHQVFLPPLRVRKTEVMGPFASVEQDVGSRDIRFLVGMRLTLPVRFQPFNEDQWDDHKISAFLTDEILLGISTANLGFNLNDLMDRIANFSPKQREEVVNDENGRRIRVMKLDTTDIGKNEYGAETVAAGIGLAAGQMAFLDSMLIDAAAKGKISDTVPNTLLGIKSALGAGALFFSPASPDDFDNPVSEHFGHAMILNAGLGITQRLFDIRPDNSKWILANTLAGGALLVGYARRMKEREQITVMKNGETDTDLVLKETQRNAHWALAGTALLSYGLNFWLYTKGWNRF